MYSWYTNKCYSIYKCISWFTYKCHTIYKCEHCLYIYLQTDVRAFTNRSPFVNFHAFGFWRLSWLVSYNFSKGHSLRSIICLFQLRQPITWAYIWKYDWMWPHCATSVQCPVLWTTTPKRTSAYNRLHEEETMAQLHLNMLELRIFNLAKIRTPAGFLFIVCTLKIGCATLLLQVATAHFW